MEKINQLFAAGMKKVAVPAVLVAPFVATAARADEASITKAIQDAIASGTTNYGTVTAGVITVAALGFCVGMIVSWLKK